MSYSDKINNNIITVSKNDLLKVTQQLGLHYSVPTATSNIGSDGYDKVYNNIHLTINGKDYEIKNTSRNKDTYNLYDLIAVAKTAGLSNGKISDALNDAEVYDHYDNGDIREWTADAVKSVNTSTTAATAQIQQYLTEHYKELDPYVSTLIKPNGKDYVVRVTYIDPKTGDRIYRNIDSSLPDIDKTLSDTALKDLFEKTLGNELDTAKTNTTLVSNTNTAAQGQMDLAEKVLTALNGNVGTTANSNNTLSDADRAAVQAVTPGTDNLTAWNQAQGANVSDKVIANKQGTPELVKRATLEDLQGLAKQLSDEQLSVTQRGINNQKAQLLQSIAKDPELYAALTQQMRADNAAGTIAGQRAANAQQVAREADATYDTQAAELYKNLFSKDSNVAQKAFSDSYDAQKGVLDQYTTSILNNAMEAARQGQITSQDLQTILGNLATATGVDVLKYANEVAEGQTAAGGKATDLMSKLSSTASTERARNNAALQEIADTLDIGENLLNQGANGGANVTDALQTVLKALGENKSYGGGYTTVQAGDYTKAQQLENKQYNDIVNNEEFRRFLEDRTIDSLTKAKTLNNIRNQFKSNTFDFLTEEGLNKLYTGYADDANKQSNKIFNEAQRAYIASITAGDTKTAEQLTRLATSAGASKGNLYAASALANQFKQQSGLSASGRQLATDFLNQQSYNHNNITQAALDANAAATKYIGNGNDNLDAGTLYGILNTEQQNAANNRQYYSQFANSVMNATQDINSERVKNQINNHDRLAELASGVTDINALNAVNNITNKGTKNTYTTRAKATYNQGASTLGKPTKY